MTEPATAARTVLYIDDDEDAQALMAALLAHRGSLELLSASNGRTGLEVAVTRRPDLILLDLGLPDISGPAVLEWLRASERTRDIPVIVISAYRRDESDLNPAANIAAYVEKPLDDVFAVARLVLEVAGLDPRYG